MTSLRTRIAARARAAATASTGVLRLVFSADVIVPAVFIGGLASMATACALVYLPLGIFIGGLMATSCAALFSIHAAQAPAERDS